MQRDALIKVGVDPEWIHGEHGSGGKMDRPVFKQLTRLMMCHHDRFVVWKLDRQGRTLTGMIEAVEEMTRQNFELISLTEKVDTSSAMGRAFFNIAKREPGRANYAA